MVSFRGRQEMAPYETGTFYAVTEMVLFCDAFHDALREYQKPTGWTWETNDARFILYVGRKHLAQAPNPLVCDAGIEQRGALFNEAFITPVYFTMKALCKIPGRIDITAHYTAEGKPLLDYLVKGLELTAGFPGKTSEPDTADFPQSDAADTAHSAQSDQAGEPPAWVNEKWYLSLTVEDRDRYDRLYPLKDDWEAGDITEADIAEKFGKTVDTTRGWRRSLLNKGALGMKWQKRKGV